MEEDDTEEDVKCTKIYIDSPIYQKIIDFSSLSVGFLTTKSLSPSQLRLLLTLHTCDFSSLSIPATSPHSDTLHPCDEVSLQKKRDFSRKGRFNYKDICINKWRLYFILVFVLVLERTKHIFWKRQALLAYGLNSSRRAPDALHPYGYSKERFVWSLISAVGIFCLGSGATIVHGFQNLWTSQQPENVKYAALVIGGSFLIEGASLLVAIQAVTKGAAAEKMSIRDYVWRGHDPTSVAVMTEICRESETTFLLLRTEKLKSVLCIWC